MTVRRRFGGSRTVARGASAVPPRSRGTRKARREGSRSRLEFLLSSTRTPPLELPGTGNHEEPSSLEGRLQLEDRHDAGVLAVLSAHTAAQAWWLGYLETGSTYVVFGDARRLGLYAQWPYVLIEAGPEQARVWRDDGR
jgi:hypothetical protein